MDLRPKYLSLAGVLLILLTPFFTTAQSKTIRGYVKDRLSDERISFASLNFKLSRNGRLTDSAGSFTFHFDQWPNDTLEVTYVGYQDVKIPINPEFIARISKDGGHSIDLVVSMDRGKVTSEVIVKRKIDRGYLESEREKKRLETKTSDICRSF